jgi:hypothetical protein
MDAYVEWVKTKIPKSIRIVKKGKAVKIPMHDHEIKEKEKREKDPIYKSIKE